MNGKIQNSIAKLQRALLEESGSSHLVASHFNTRGNNSMVLVMMLLLMMMFVMMMIIMIMIMIMMILMLAGCNSYVDRVCNQKLSFPT